jgi:hypothetical protein
MCLDLNFAHLAVAGIGCDIAGAFSVAWSLSANSPERISRDIPMIGMAFGTPEIARAAARQRAEARLGIFLLVGGFLLQGLVYFFPHPRASLHTWAERGIGLAILVIIWIVAAIIYRLYVPWDERRTFDRALQMQQRGGTGVS